MRVWHSLGQRWKRADGEDLNTAHGWFAVEVRIQAGSIALRGG
jgi:hypothetical protein